MAEPSEQPLPGNEIAQVLAQQRDWAARESLDVNPAGTRLVEPYAGLFRQELFAETLAELRDGAGAELERVNSLRSSSCLAINVFEPWRPSPGILGEVFGYQVKELSFEAKKPTGLTGTPPHLDVLLSGFDGVIGIECKFLEIYQPAINHFAESYFDAAGLWSQLPNSRRYAERIRDGMETFEWLPAGQLIKHALGLSKNYSEEFRLTLVWYRVEGPTADVIEGEIGRFARGVSDDFHFTAMTYQELVSRLKLNVEEEPAPGYYDYLKDRYELGHEWRPELPLLEVGSSREVNQQTGLHATIRGLDRNQLVDAYMRTVANAPQRPLRRKTFFVGHEGTGGTSAASRERVIAKALFNQDSDLHVDDRTVSLVDYEVPLRTSRGDAGVGEIDLLGVEAAANRPWIIELKVNPNTETPLKALLQTLRYSAILDANRAAVRSELMTSARMADLAWPAVIAVAADTAYWKRLEETSQAGAWLEELSDLGTFLGTALGNELVLLDLGMVDAEIRDGRPRLRRPLVISRIETDWPK